MDDLVAAVGLIRIDGREKHGEWLRIEKTDGSTIEGELLKVSGETLLLFDEFSQHGCQVNAGDMLRLGLRRRTDVLGGIGIGLLAGIGVGFAGGVIFKAEEPVRSMLQYMPLGMIAGMLTNGFQGRFQTRRLAGLAAEKRSTLIGELAGMSREARNYYPGIMR